MTQWTVLKFGGSSVADPNLWSTIARQVSLQLNQDCRPILVLSALKNVSNLLEALLHQALAGVHQNAIYHLKELHYGFASQLGVDVDLQLAQLFDQLSADCEQIYQSKEISPEYHARVVSVGELLSTTIGAEYLRQYGLNAELIDVREYLKTEDKSGNDPWHHFTSNEGIYELNLAMQEQLKTRSKILVTQGFIASDQLGRTVLLGREGSDTSASYLAAMLGANKIEIWTDVPGVFSFNPRIIPEALQIMHMDYAQAELLAAAGAKVLHPRAIRPARENGIPIAVRCSQLSEHPGTFISEKAAHCSQVLAMALTSNVICVKSDKQSQDHIEKLLSPMGFDRLNILSESTNVGLYVFTHTDLQQPSGGQLVGKLDSNEILINEKLSAITLVGSIDSTQWIEEVIKYCDTQYHQKFLKYLPEPDAGQLTILVETHDETLFCQQLHRGMIEENHTDVCFSVSWSQFV
ncbi:aspartate kinase [Pleionea sediminis]|uniref:aspartate kinase n=1 Tax=Pleionea sediminis TaxID=2569479 RepID=UPI0011847E71|nr:aspartate kinase [Pleionea sediminis]